METYYEYSCRGPGMYMRYLIPGTLNGPLLPVPSKGVLLDTPYPVNTYAR